MRFIKVTSIKDKKPVYINPDFIGHIYRVPAKEYKYGTVDEIEHTVIGVTTHNNGGFRVIEDIDEIFKNDRSF